MSRVAVCLFFIAILQYGIQISSQADNSSKQETTEESKKDKDTTTQEPVKEEAKETKKEKDDSTKSVTDKITKSPLDHLNPTGIEFTGKVLGPVMKVRAKVGDVVSRGMDSAKDVADGAYNFFRDSVTTFF